MPQDPHAQVIARHAAALAPRLRRRTRAARPPRGPARLARLATAARRTAARHLRGVFREHWDLGVFDLAFGSLKAFGLYPALYLAGLAWTIPLLEYAPLNTQLWTAGYLFARRKIASAWGRLRYGHSLDALDALRDRLLDVSPSDARAAHRFRAPGAREPTGRGGAGHPEGSRRPAAGYLQVRVRRSRIRGWWERWRGRTPAPGVIGQRELRRLLGDPELRFRTGALRANPYLYERVLLEALLADPGARPELLARAIPPPRLAGPAAELAALLGDGPEPVRARLELARDRLARFLRRRLGGRLSPVALGLRALLASWRRRARRTLAAIADLEHRVLADLAEGRGPAHSAWSSRLRRGRRALCADLERGEALVERAAGVRSVAEARRLLVRELAGARAAGLPARRAHLAALLDGILDAAPGTAAAPLAERVQR